MCHIFATRIGFCLSWKAEAVRFLGRFSFLLFILCLKDFIEERNSIRRFK
jgi:hypothetical protein